jgi:hypothetical protein
MSDNDLYIRLKAEGIETLGQLQAKIKQLKTELKGVSLNTKEFTSKKSELKGLQTAMKDLNGTAGGLHSTYFKLGTVIRQATVAFGTVAAAAYSFYKVIEMGEKSARLELLQSTLSQIARKDGVDFARVMGDIGKETNFTLSRMESLQSVMKLSMLDIDWKEMPRILAFAKDRSDMLGMSFEEVLNSLEKAAMGSKRAMKQLLIPVDVEQSVKDYARSLGVQADELTEAGKQHALFNAILKKGEEQHLNINKAAMNQLDTYEQLKAAWSDLGTSAGILAGKLSPLVSKLAEVAKMWNLMIQGVFGEKQEEYIEIEMPSGGGSTRNKPVEIDYKKVGARKLKQFEEGLKDFERSFKQQEKLREALRKAADKRAKAGVTGWNRRKSAMNERGEGVGGTNRAGGSTEDESELFQAERFLKNYNKGLSVQGQIVMGLADGIDGLANKWSNTIMGLMQGTMNIGQAFRSMASQVIESLEQIIAKMIAMKIIESLIGLITGGAAVGAAAGASSAGSFMGTTITAHSKGGWLNEPVIGVGMSSGRLHSFAEKQPEYISTMNQAGRSSRGGMMNIAPYIQLIPVAEAAQFSVLVKVGDQQRADGRTI